MDALSPSIIKRAEAICVAIKEIYYLQAEYQVKNVLAIRNGLNTIPTLNLLILLKVYIQHEKDGQNRLYKLLAINSKIYIINMPHKPTNF